MEYLTVPLNTSHKKQLFDCGNEQLNRYLHRQAKQDVKRKLSTCFVLPDTDGEIKGFYTLSNGGIPRNDLPESIARKLPSTYYSIPVTLLGRLAIGKQFQGQNLGKHLLIEALTRSYKASESLGSIAVIVDPINEQAQLFYQKYSFIQLPNSKRMFLPMKTISFLLSQ